MILSQYNDKYIVPLRKSTIYHDQAARCLNMWFCPCVVYERCDLSVKKNTAKWNMYSAMSIPEMCMLPIM